MKIELESTKQDSQNAPKLSPIKGNASIGEGEPTNAMHLYSPFWIFSSVKE